MEKNFYDIAAKWNCLKEAIKNCLLAIRVKKVPYRTIPIDKDIEKGTSSSSTIIVSQSISSSSSTALIFFSRNSPINLRIFVCIMCLASKIAPLYVVSIQNVRNWIWLVASSMHKSCLDVLAGNGHYIRKPLCNLCGYLSDLFLVDVQLYSNY